ncbi:MAG TPA: hypothetical protein PLR99_13935 [Polyangiaceae bacterium]|nr:hypothetical protein [Polyangiaceae bacterium]
MAKRPKRDRTVRREASRALDKSRAERLALAKLEAGGAPERPRVVSTAALVEPTARSLPCPACGGSVRLVEHTAEERAGRRLRVCVVDCSACGARVERFFEVAPPLLN